MRALLAMILFAACGVHADSWRFPATVRSEVETHGDVTIRRIRDARKNQHFPDYTIEISRGQDLLARISGVSYEKLFAAPDNSFFVGLSNDGLPGTAVIVFDREGRLRLEVKHDFALFDYCEHSITRVRRWFDEENLAVSFKKDPRWGGYTVTLRTCRGKEVDLMAEVRSAYNRSFEKAAAGRR